MDLKNKREISINQLTAILSRELNMHIVDIRLGDGVVEVFGEPREDVVGARISIEDAIAIREARRGEDPPSYRELGEKYGISHIGARNVAVGRSWKHIDWICPPEEVDNDES